MVVLTCPYCGNEFDYHPTGFIGSMINEAFGGPSEEKVRCPSCKLIINK